MNAAASHSIGDYGALRRLYARYAASYDRRFSRYSEGTLERAVAALADQAPGRLLDVACGTGLLAERIRRRWPQTPVIGVDLSAEMLEMASRRMPRHDGSGGGPLTDWRVGPAEALPVADGAADTLTCTNAFHLVQQPAQALAEFRRALAPGGRLLLVDWNREFLSMRLMLLGLRVFRRQRRVAWTLNALLREVRRAGFAVTSSARAPREPPGCPETSAVRMAPQSAPPCSGGSFKLGPVWGLLWLVAVRT
jgi:ubiquinone/menaquinone biosynthesis C-methylase UbiE